MRYRVRRTGEAIEQFRGLSPYPKGQVKEALRRLELDPYGPASLRLKTQESTFRVRAGHYRVLYKPGPGDMEITVFRIALRELAYEGFEHPDSRPRSS